MSIEPENPKLENEPVEASFASSIPQSGTADSPDLNGQQLGEDEVFYSLDAEPAADTNRSTDTKVTPYQMYVRQRQQQETRVFLTISGIMGILLVFSLLVFFGLLRIPFLEGLKAPVQYARSGSVPCPLSETPVAPDKLEVQVYNTSGVKGLAKEVSKGLEERRMKITSIGNSDRDDFKGEVLIVTGPTGVNGAYTLANAFNSAEIKMDTRPGTNLTVYLGSNFEKLRSVEEFKSDSKQDLQPLPKCREVKLV